MPTQEELNNKYGNNLSVTSNDPQLIQRDQSGNISPDLSKTVYIEPTVWKYDTDSINQLINTNFNYYTFPPKLILEDVDIPDEFNVETPDIGTKFDSRYKAEPQYVPIIELFVPDRNGGIDGINYGWNEVGVTQVDVETKVGTIKRFKVGAQIDKPATGELQRRSKYYRAHETAREEVKNGISTGRYTALWADGTWFDIKSLFEGHFRKINFSEIIDGLPQTVPGSFKVTQDLIDSKKSLQFNIQIAVSHEDNTARNNFMIRLVRTRTNSPVTEPYQVLKIVSSAEQGQRVSINQDQNFENLGELKSRRDIYQQVLLKTQIKIDELTEKITRLETIYQNFKQKAAKLALQALADWSMISTATAALKLAVKFYDQLKDAKQIRVLLLDIAVEYTNLFNEWNGRYIVALANTQIDPKSPEGVLNGALSNLLPGKTFFNLNYTLSTVDMQLNDIYSVEMLGAGSQFYAPELIEDNTYWDIKEISDTIVYTPQQEANNWNNTNIEPPTQNELAAEQAQLVVAAALSKIKATAKLK